jgi:hypothetical protein
MRRSVAFTLVQALFVSALGCAGEKAKTPTGSDLKGIEFHRQAAGEPGPDGWYEAQSTHGGFSVLLPGPFNDFTQTGLSEEGGKVIIHVVGMVSPMGVKYSALAMSSADDKGLPKSNLEGLATTAEKEGALRGKQEVVWEGQRGVELYIKEAKTAAKTRGYDVGGTRYRLIAEFPSDAEPAVMADVDKFLGSLKSLK